MYNVVKQKEKKEREEEEEEERKKCRKDEGVRDKGGRRNPL